MGPPGITFGGAKPDAPPYMGAHPALSRREHRESLRRLKDKASDHHRDDIGQVIDRPSRWDVTSPSTNHMNSGTAGNVRY